MFNILLDTKNVNKSDTSMKKATPSLLILSFLVKSELFEEFDKFMERSYFTVAIRDSDCFEEVRCKIFKEGSQPNEQDAISYIFIPKDRESLKRYFSRFDAIGKTVLKMEYEGALADGDIVPVILGEDLTVKMKEFLLV